jgi:malonate transporter and related proteins
MHVFLLILPDFLLIALGALLRRTFGFDAAFWSGVERLVYFVLFPALLFRSLATAPLALSDAAVPVGIVVAVTVAGMLLSALAAPLFRLPHDTFAACFQCAFRINTYVTLAVASRMAGDRGVALVSLFIGVLVPIVNIAAVGMLARGRGTRVAFELARNPLVLASVAGMLWNMTGLPVPAVAARILDLLAAGALPIALLAVGAGLRLALGMLPPAAIAWWNGVKLVALPAIAWFLAHRLGLPPFEMRMAVLAAAAPTATSAYILAVQMNGHGAPVALLITTQTLLAAITLPLWMAATA